MYFPVVENKYIFHLIAGIKSELHLNINRNTGTNNNTFYYIYSNAKYNGEGGWREGGLLTALWGTHITILLSFLEIDP